MPGAAGAGDTDATGATGATGVMGGRPVDRGFVVNDFDGFAGVPDMKAAPRTCIGRLGALLLINWVGPK